MKKKWLLFPFALALLVLVRPAFLAAGGIPVYDAISDLNRIIEHEMTIVKMTLQIEQLQAYRQQFSAFESYRRWIDGEFQQVRARLSGDLTHIVQSGNPDSVLVDLGTPFSGTEAAQDLDQAIQTMRGVMNGSDLSEFGLLGQSVRAIVGESPATVVGARTKAATEEIGAQIAWVNRINAAVNEKSGNIEYLRERINSGALTPGDLQRDLTILATEQADLQTLQIQAQTAATRVALQQLSLQAGEVNGREVERIQDSHDRLNLMQGVASFSLATPPPQQ